MTTDLLTGLPAEALMRQGVADLAEGRPTVAALLAAIASIRLQAAGLLSPAVVLPVDAELQLYARLGEEGGDTYSRYNALVREVVSFEQALDGRTTRLGARAQADSPGTTTPRPPQP